MPGSGSLRLALHFLVLGMLLDTVLAGKAWPALSPDGEPDLVLLWSDPEGLLTRKLTPSGRVAVEREIDAVFGAAGIRVAWSPSLSNLTARRCPNVLFIVVVPRSGQDWGLPRNVIGAVLGNDPRRRALYIFFPNLLLGVGDWSPPTKTLHQPGDVRKFARAAARVIAHEVVHAVDPTLRHSSASGLMREHLTPELLQRERLALDPNTATRLRTSLRSASSPSVSSRTADATK